MNRTDRVNYLNILFMLLSVAAAICLPFELFLFSYAFLGPAHYLTEISWLHDRKYFTPLKTDFIILGIIAILYVLFISYTPLHSAARVFIKTYAPSVIFVIFGLAFIFIAAPGRNSRLLLSAILIAGILLVNSYNALKLIFGLYLSTLIHVYIFTGAFILYGALKSGSRSGYLSFIVFVLCPLLCLFLFRSHSTTVSNWATAGYSSFAHLNRNILLSLHLSSQNIFKSQNSILITRIIAFAYTYHYLNWFSKTSVIRWHQVSRLRIIIVAALFLCFISIYLWDYKTGLRTLFFLSFMHVVLEFPLNHHSFIGIGKELRKRWQNRKENTEQVAA